MDAVLCSVQTGTQESQASRSHSLRVRLGLVTTVVIRIGLANISYERLSAPLAMRDINLTRQHRPTLPSGHALRDGTVRACTNALLMH